MAFVAPIMANFFKFDFLIILLAMLTGYIYYRCWRYARDLNRILQPKGNLAMGSGGQEAINRHFDYYLDDRGESRIIEQRQRMDQGYIFFLNLVAVFPLMGLLGTVLALIPMVEALETNFFFMALTSTFWGIVFAIVFKILNGPLQALVEENAALINTYLMRRDVVLAQQLQVMDHE